MELEQERLLIEQLQKNKDPEAFGKLYDRYYPVILKFLLYRTADEDLAKDLTSETFYQALKNLWKFRWQGKPFSAWLYRIAYNQFMLYLRKNKHYCQLTCEESPELIAKLDERQDMRLIEKQDEAQRIKEYRAMREALKELPERQHSILILRYFSKKTIAEIANILRIPEGTVKSHIHRSLKRLEAMLTHGKNASDVLSPEFDFVNTKDASETQHYQRSLEYDTTANQKS